MAKTGLEDRYLVAIRSLLQRVMDERGLKQADAAREIGIPQSQVSAVLSETKGTGLGVPGLIRLADYACVSLDEAIGRAVPDAKPIAPRHPKANEPSTGSAAVRRATKTKRGEDPADVIDQMMEQMAALRAQMGKK